MYDIWKFTVLIHAPPSRQLTWYTCDYEGAQPVHNALYELRNAIELKIFNETQCCVQLATQLLIAEEGAVMKAGMSVDVFALDRPVHDPDRLIL
jgi:hypothetical protein